MKPGVMVAVGLVVLAVVLRATGVARTITGDAQIVYAVALGLLLVRLVYAAVVAPRGDDGGA